MCIEFAAGYAHIDCRCPKGFQAGEMTFGMEERPSRRAGAMVNSPKCWLMASTALLVLRRTGSLAIKKSSCWLSGRGSRAVI